MWLVIEVVVCEVTVIGECWYIHSCPKSGCELVALFDSYFYDGVPAGMISFGGLLSE